MKKKITALCLCVALLAVAVVGASLAYFTDNDQADNTFTAGSVKIQLIEEQSNADHTGFVPYDGDKVLMPIVGSAQGEKYPNGQPMAENYIDKVVTIKNTGTSAAWIRAYYAVPSALDDGYETFNAGVNVLHFNFGNEDGASTYGVQWIWKHGDKWNYFETTIDGVAYNVYYADYYQPLAAGATTEQFVSGVYLDKSFNQQDGKYYAFGEEIDLSGLISDDGELTVKCPVKAVAVQAAGFASVDAAITEAFGANYNPFGGTAANWQ